MHVHLEYRLTKRRYHATREDEVIACIQPLVEMLESIFSRLTLAEKNLQPFKAVSDEDLNHGVNILRGIDPDFDPLIIRDSKKSIKDLSPKLKSFLENHPIERHYMFSIKKCGDVDCVCGPIRLHQNVFEKLHHLPDPRPSPSNPEK